MTVEKAIEILKEKTQGRKEPTKYCEVKNGIVLFTKHDNLKIENSMFLIDNDGNIFTTNPIITDINLDEIKPINNKCFKASCLCGTSKV